MLTEIKDKMDIPNDKAGLLQTAFIISYMICAPIFGYLGDRYNRKITMGCGVFLWCLTSFLGSFMKVRGGGGVTISFIATTRDCCICIPTADGLYLIPSYRRAV